MPQDNPEAYQQIEQAAQMVQQAAQVLGPGAPPQALQLLGQAAALLQRLQPAAEERPEERPEAAEPGMTAGRPPQFRKGVFESVIFPKQG